MYANWQCPYPNAGLSLGSLASDESARKPTAATRKSRRDRFDYWLIFSVSLVVFAWLGLVERCSPTFWLARHTQREASFWAQAKKGAHHFATMAFQG